MFMMAPTILRPLLVAAGIAPVTVEKSGATATQISVPAGATTATIECIGCGGASSGNNSGGFGGTGGYYSKRSAVSLSGVANLYIDISNSEFVTKSPTSVRFNNSDGEIVCSAPSGANGYSAAANSGVGDIKYNGGLPSSLSGSGRGGGGAGRTGNGGNASADFTGGAGQGNSPGGNGGNNATNNGRGLNYGGGGGGYVAYDDEGNPGGWISSFGGDGWVSITFT